jgi:penicillin-binding protein 1B
MKKAVALPPYSDAKPFPQPSGVVDVQLDKATNLLATPACPETYTAAFVAGTEPVQTCDQGNGIKGFFSRMLGIGGDKALPPPQAGNPQHNPQNGANPQAAGEEQKKKGFFGKIVGIFKDDKSSNPPAAPQGNDGNGPR